MVDCKPFLTVVDTQAKVSAKSRPHDANPTHFRSFAGSLQYLTFTHLDIAYTIQQVCLHMHDPREPHLTAMKHILYYLWVTLVFSLLLRRYASSELTLYTNADWVGCLDTCQSILSYAMFLGTILVSCSSKCQNIISCSSARAEYRVMANDVAEACWL
jgi:hypothetical protein